jgi:hypothetical protein
MRLSRRAVTTHLLQRVGAGVHTSVAAFWDPHTDGTRPAAQRMHPHMRARCTRMRPLAARCVSSRACAPLRGAALALARQGVRGVGERDASDHHNRLLCSHLSAGAHARTHAAMMMLRLRWLREGTRCNAMGRALGARAKHMPMSRRAVGQEGPRARRCSVRQARGAGATARVVSCGVW